MAIQVPATREELALAYAAEITHVSVHTGAPGATGANELGTVARLPVTWIAGGTEGTVASDTLDFSIPADTTVSHLGFWTASTGGEFRDSLAVGVVFVSAGHYIISIQFTIS